ncbi:MAG: hypothetical protein LBH57_04390 [Treponema sp.]|jgi:hypothetical protein|nr:hypothetical protein [Treponema sp.]
MKAVVFTRNGKPDMRLIHEDIGDTAEAVISHIETEFEGKNLAIIGVKNYEEANEWLCFRIQMDIAQKQKKIAVLEAELAERRKHCENCEIGKWECGHCAEPKWNLEKAIEQLRRGCAA